MGKQLAACGSNGNYLQRLQVSKCICALLRGQTHPVKAWISTETSEIYFLAVSKIYFSAVHSPV